MKISRIKATNFKGASFDEALNPLTLLVGANFKGKTARIDAIIVGLLGYHPTLGKTHKATFGLSSGAAMEVELTLDDGAIVYRSWELKGNSVSYHEEIPDEIKNAGELAVMMDASLYFSLSDQKRVEYVFGLVDMAGVWTVNGIVKRLMEKCADAEKMIAVVRGQEIAGFTVQKFVDDAKDRMADEYKAAGASVKRCEATIQQLTAARAQDTIAGPGMATLEAMRTTIAAEVATLNEKKGALMTTFTRMVSDRQRRDSIDREIRFGDKNRAELVALQEKRDLTQKELDSAPPFDRSNLKAINTKIDEAKQHQRQHSSNANYARSESLQAAKDRASLEGQKVCPYCGSAGEGWKAIKEKEIQTTIDTKDGIARTEGRLASEFEETVAALFRESDAVEAAIVKRENLNSLLHSTNVQIQNLETSLARLTTMAEELGRLMADDPQLDAKVQTLQSELNVKNGELREVEAGIKVLQGRELERKRMADAEAERDAAVKEKETAKDVGTELKAIQGEMVASAFRPLLDLANSFFGPILQTPLAYNVETTEIGTWRGGVWVSHHTFSGTEKALTYAAIQAALSAKSPVRIMLLDELGRLDDANQMAVLASVEGAVLSGALDQVVGVLPSVDKADLIPGKFAPFQTLALS